MPSQEYYISERFIHDDICEAVEQGIAAMRVAWSRDHNLAPFAVSWPAETIYADDGRSIDRACAMELQAVPKEEWRQALLDLMQRTKSYALLLAEQQDGAVVVKMESQHGAKSWHLPIRRSGDIRILGAATTQVDGPHLGILWQPTLPTA